MNQLLRLFHTVRYLRAQQIVYRLYYRWRSLRAPIFPIQTKARVWKQCWHSLQWQSSDILKNDEFFFLNELGSIASENDWNNPKQSKLWLYNLHYVDVLNAQNADNRVVPLNRLIDRWIDENPAMKGNAWESYPLSLRLVNLVKWQMRGHYDGSKLLNSIQQQATALSQQIEYHIMANHLFANAKALVFAGAALSDGDVFLQKGLDILDKEIYEQFLDDGGHFELSPMYHAILLWDLCDLFNLAKSSALPSLKSRIVKWEKVIQRGLLWLYHMCHPDGNIAFFNDSTLGIAPSYSDLCQYASALNIHVSTEDKAGLSLKHLCSSGYISIRPDSKTKLILDVGRVGPNYQPGHAHADTLSFELSVFGQRLFVNSGISQYGADSQRSYQRSTQAHNTVVINNKNSSDVWGGFRVGRRANPQELQVTNTHEQVLVSCLHDGYHSLFNSLSHSRQYQVSRQHCQIIDTLTGIFKNAEARYYLHPDISVKETRSGCFECRFPSGQSVLLRFTGYTNICIENTQWYPGFGIEQENNCLVVILDQKALCIDITW